MQHRDTFAQTMSQPTVEIDEDGEFVLVQKKQPRQQERRQARPQERKQEYQSHPQPRQQERQQERKQERQPDMRMIKDTALQLAMLVIGLFVKNPEQGIDKLRQEWSRLTAPLCDAPEPTEAEKRRHTTNNQIAMNLVEKLVGYYAYQLLSVLRESLTKIRTPDGFPAHHWLAWSYVRTQPIPGWNPTLEDKQKTVVLLLEMLYSPLERNGFGETLYESMRKARETPISRVSVEKYLDVTTYKMLYDAYTHLPLNVLKRCATYCINMLNASTMDDIGVKICWIASQNVNLLAETIVDTCKYGKGKDKGVYASIQILLTNIRIALQKGPGASKDFEDYFRQVPWNGKSIATALRTKIRELVETIDVTQVRECDAFSTTSYDVKTDAVESVPDVREQFPIDIIGALVGECKNAVDCIKYIVECLRDPQRQPLAVTCLAHAHARCKGEPAVLTPKLQTTIEETKFEHSYVRYLIFDVIEQITGVAQTTKIVAKPTVYPVPNMQSDIETYFDLMQKINIGYLSSNVGALKELCDANPIDQIMIAFVLKVARDVVGEDKLTTIAQTIKEAKLVSPIIAAFEKILQQNMLEELDAPYANKTFEQLRGKFE